MSLRFGISVPLLLALSGTALGQSFNEIRIDQPVDDNDEYVELAGQPGTDLGLLTIIVIGDSAGGLSGVIEAIVPLTGQVIGASGYFLVGEPTMTLAVPDYIANLSFENSDNLTFLLVSGFTGTVSQDLDTNDDGVLDVMPWAAELDRIALLEEDNPPVATEYHYGPPTVGPDGLLVPGHVLRCPDSDPLGVFTIGQFDPAMMNDTPGAINDCPGNIDAGVVDAAVADAAAADAAAVADAAAADAAAVPDAAVPDASPDTADSGPDALDARPRPDAGTTAGGGDGGCCSVGGNQGLPGGNLVLALLIVLVLVSRRRRDR